jgi:hypothetical protein
VPQPIEVPALPGPAHFWFILGPYSLGITGSGLVLARDGQRSAVVRLLAERSSAGFGALQRSGVAVSGRLLGLRTNPFGRKGFRAENGLNVLCLA